MGSNDFSKALEIMLLSSILVYVLPVIITVILLYFLYRKKYKKMKITAGVLVAYMAITFSFFIVAN